MPAIERAIHSTRIFYMCLGRCAMSPTQMYVPTHLSNLLVTPARLPPFRMYVPPRLSDFHMERRSVRPETVCRSVHGRKILSSVLCVVPIIIKLFRNEDFVGEFGEFRRGTSKSTSEPVGLNFRRSTPNRWTKIWHILPIAISPVLF